MIVSKKKIKKWGKHFKMRYEYKGKVYDTIEEVDEAIIEHEGHKYNNDLPEYMFEREWEHEVEIIIEGVNDES